MLPRKANLKLRFLNFNSNNLTRNSSTIDFLRLVRYIIFPIMRPKNLKFPFSWQERKPVLHEGVFIVPQGFEHHHLWKDEECIFSSHLPIFIEFCSGNGDWVIEKARLHPDKFWIAVEKEFERVQKIWSKMHNHSIDNLLIVCGEALTFTKHYLKSESIQEIFVNFPDPWPKRRHAKHRLLQGHFIQELARVIKRGGTSTFATDDPPYSEQMIGEMLAHPQWKSLFSPPYYVKSWDDYGNSWFQNLWEKKGHSFFYMQFERI